jgi:thioredoxin-like negative regulator of GroEL
MYSVMQKIRPGLDFDDEISFIDWQNHRELAENLDVFGVPTLIIFSAGRKVEWFSGVTSETVLQRYIETLKKALIPIHDQTVPERDAEPIDPVKQTNR